MDEMEPVLPKPVFTPSLSGSISDSESVAAVQELVAGPSTPRRPASAGAPAYVYRTPQSAQRANVAIPLAVDGEEDEVVDMDDEDPYEEDVGLRRFRPILLDHKQWGQRAPALDRRRATLRQETKALVEKWGHPFAWIRTGNEYLRSASLT